MLNSLPVPYTRSSLFWLLFDSFWKVKTKYIVLCLNGLAKFWNAWRASCHPATIGNCLTCNHMSQPYKTSEWFAISPLHMICGPWDAVVTRQLSCEKCVGLKYMQVEVLKSVTKMTKMRTDMPTDQIADRVQMHQVCDVAVMEGIEAVKQGGKTF